MSEPKITTPEQAIERLRELQSQIIHGPKVFGEIADVVEELLLRYESALPEKTQASCWEILGVDPLASEFEIQKAYRRKAVLAHPDAVGGASEPMVALNAARGIALSMVRNGGAQ
jgi:hypothetical protein